MQPHAAGDERVSKFIARKPWQINLLLNIRYALFSNGAFSPFFCHGLR